MTLAQLEIENHLNAATGVHRTNKRTIFLRTALLSLVMLMIGVVGYYLGTQTQGTQQGAQTQITERSNVPLAVEPANDWKPNYPPLPYRDSTFTGSSGMEYQLYSITDVDRLRSGFASAVDEVKYEAFFFADLSDGAFSKTLLASYGPYMQTNYPTIRLRYLHSVLNYRDQAKAAAALDTLHCLNEQRQVWPQMVTLAEQQANPNFEYALPDLPGYDACVAARQANPSLAETEIFDGQSLMQEFNIQGAPTTLLMSSDNLTAVKIMGAVPLESLQQDMPMILEKLDN